MKVTVSSSLPTININNYFHLHRYDRQKLTLCFILFSLICNDVEYFCFIILYLHLLSTWHWFLHRLWANLIPSRWLADYPNTICWIIFPFPTDLEPHIRHKVNYIILNFFSRLPILFHFSRCQTDWFQHQLI